MSSQPPKRSLRIRDIGYSPGELSPGPRNSILDVAGVHVAQLTVPTSPSLPAGCEAKKGCTIVCPRGPGDSFKPCKASTFTFNGNGELTGSHNIADWGFVNTPIVFTNSNSLGTCYDVVWDWMLDQRDALGWDDLTAARNYGTPVVGETCDWWINSDVRATRLDKGQVLRTFGELKDGENGGVIVEGQAGGGAGMTCHQFTGGTGTSSRMVEDVEGRKYTVGALVQTNYGVRKDFHIGSVPVGMILAKEAESRGQGDVQPFQASSKPAPAGETRVKDGSILILVITDAPLATHQLNRLARHATVGLASVGRNGVGKTFSGDIILAVSTAQHSGPEQLEKVPLQGQRFRPTETYTTEVLKNESIDTYFAACSEAVEEAILNSVVAASEGMTTMDGGQIEGFPVERVRELLDQYLVRI